MQKLSEAQIKDLAKKAAPKTTTHAMRDVTVSRRRVVFKDGDYVISKPTPGRSK